MRVRSAVPEISLLSVAPWFGAATMTLSAWINTDLLPLAGVVFALCLLVPPLTTKPRPVDITTLGADSVRTRLAASATRGTAALWLALGTMTTYLVLSDVNPTTPGVIVAIVAAGGIVVTTSARRLTSVSLLSTTIRQQRYPGLMATALAATRTGVASGIVAISVWERFQGLAWALSLLTVVILGVAAGIVFFAVTHQPRWKKENLEALAAVKPEYAVHISGPSGSAYQLAMWLPYLERAGKPYIIIVREATLFQEIIAVATAPVVHVRTLGDLDQVLALNFGTVFYVNNGVKNGHLVRRANIHHVQLLHGESDKVSSRNPVAAMYDSLFVAGQAAVDRYHNHGVAIVSERFRIVGRPQVDVIEGAVERPEGTPTTLLYAPTWNGFFDDADYSSLSVGLDLVNAALAEGARIIFRPHPYSAKSAALRDAVKAIDARLAEHAAASGLDHVYGERATTGSTTTECFNSSDAMVSDVSSVPIDYLFSEKPLAIVEMHAGSLDRTPGAATLAVGSYVITPGDDYAAAMHALLREDTKAEARALSRVYYLADFAREGYADVFVDAIRETVDAHNRVPDEGEPEDEFDDVEGFAEAEADAEAEAAEG